MDSSQGLTFQLHVMAQSTSFSSSPSTHEVTLYRTFHHLTWLYHHLQSTFPHLLLPPLPDPPTPSSDPQYLEKKRMQVQRWLRKVCGRSEWQQDKDFLFFLSDAMTKIELAVVPERRGSDKKPFMGLLRSVCVALCSTDCRIIDRG